MAAGPGVGFVQMLLIVLLGGGIGVPLGVPPREPDPVLVNLAPPECLYYTAWVGTAEADAASDNQTEQLVAEPEVQAFLAELESLARQAVVKFAGRSQLDQAITGAIPSLARSLLTSPTIIFVERVTPQPQGPDIRGALVTNLGDNAEAVKETLQKIRRQLPPRVLQDVEIGGVSCVRIQSDPKVPAVTVGFHDSYLIVAVGEQSFEGVLARAEATAPPAWLTQAVADVQMPQRPSTLAYVNLEAVIKMVGQLGGPQAQMVLDTLGLAGLQRVVSVGGLDETGFVSRTRIVAEATDRGLWKAFAEQPLTAADLARVPGDATIAAALRLDLARAVSQGLDIAREFNPGDIERFEANLAEVERRLGFQIRQDLLQSLGDVWTIHSAPSGGGLLAGWTLTVSLRDKDRFQATQDKLLQVLRAEFARAPQDRAPNIRPFEVGEVKAYTLEVPADGFVVAPSWCVTDAQLVVALFPQALRSYLGQRPETGSIADQPAVASLLSAERAPCALSYQDTRNQFLLFYPLLQIGAQAASQQLAREGLKVDAGALPSTAAVTPHLLPSVWAARKTNDGFEFVSHGTLPVMNAGASAPVAVALLLPAVQAAREAARRAQSMNNLKQIGLALHNYHDVHRGFPPAYNVDKEGKPLLSWRVHILPYIEQQALYDQFHLDEPWDSEHNKKLIQHMPPTFRSPNSAAEQGRTIYLGSAGSDGIFVPAKEAEPARPIGRPFAEITDGTSNTIAVVEASDSAAVIWTKPDDFVPKADNPLQGLLGTRPGGFIALLCDGSVRFISASVDRNVLKALFTANGGEAIGMDF